MTQNGNTRDRILSCSTELFAVKGYDAVSVKDIAQAVGIKPASLYNYFCSKESIFDEILAKFEQSYITYFDNLTKEIEGLTDTKEIMNAVFKAFKSSENLFMHYGMIIVLKHQFYNEKAKNIAFSLLYTYSIDKIKGYIDRLILKDNIPACNSKAIASFIMLSIFSGTEFKLHQNTNDTILPLDVNAVFDDLNDFIHSSICG